MPHFQVFDNLPITHRRYTGIFTIQPVDGDKPSVPFQHFGIGAGFFELGKFVRKVENWEKLRNIKSKIPISTH